MKNRRIVMINDKRKSLGDLEEVLMTSGHELIVVDDPFTAVNMVLASKPDVILLELKMPDKNGFELADEINYALKTRKVPIITMSSFYKKEFTFLLNLCGITRHLKKPFNPLDIIWAIENVTENNDHQGHRKHASFPVIPRYN